MLSESVAIQKKIEIVPLTMELAKHYNRMNTLKGDRDPDSYLGIKRQGYLFGQLKAGLFHSPEWAYCILLAIRKNQKQKIFRINGGNSSRMLVNSGSYFPKDLKAIVIVFEAKTMDEILDLYEQWDNVISVRTERDIINSRIKYIEGLNDITPTIVKYSAKGIACHLKLRNPKEKFDPIELIRPYAHFVKWSSNFINDRKLKRPGVIGAMFNTYNFDIKDSIEFWSSVKNLSGPDLKYPPRTLGEFLKECIFTQGKYKNSNQKWSQKAYYVKCLHAWNAWKKGNTTNLHYHDGSPLPEIK